MDYYFVDGTELFFNDVLFPRIMGINIFHTNCTHSFENNFALGLAFKSQHC